VRALEAAAQSGELCAGSGVATLRLGPASVPRTVDGLVSGLHAPGESHFELLQAFAPRDRLERALSIASAAGLSSHELGDACLVLRA
jgi:S-adenosylmethionine:tRNA ribosyltransferase-isomerase